MTLDQATIDRRNADIRAALPGVKLTETHPGERWTGFGLVIYCEGSKPSESEIWRVSWDKNECFARSSTVYAAVLEVQSQYNARQLRKEREAEEYAKQCAAFGVEP